MLIFFCITTVLIIIYGILIWYYHYSWKKVLNFDIKAYSGWQPHMRISVIIAARNEEKTILNCLNALSLQTYPKNLLEIIVVNDHSTDRTADVVKQFSNEHVRLLNLSEFLNGSTLNSYKKKAIELGISYATGDLIVTTDADCIARSQWIESIAAFKDCYNAAFIAAPVKINTGHSLLSIFQSLDFLTLQGITGASVNNRFHTMCNGANMAYEKDIFYEVNGFKGIDHIASGDDLLLMQKIAVKYPDRVFYLKCSEAIVSTEAVHGWRNFFNQRIRWASKAGHYEDKNITAVLILVYFLNLSLFIFLIAGLINVTWLFFFFLLIFTKTILEFSFVKTMALFFKLKNIIAYFPFFQPIHILYTVIAGWLGIFGTYEWKARKLR